MSTARTQGATRRVLELTGPQQGYLALGVFLAFALLPLRAFVALALLLGGAMLTRPDNRFVRSYAQRRWSLPGGHRR